MAFIRGIQGYLGAVQRADDGVIRHHRSKGGNSPRPIGREGLPGVGGSVVAKHGNAVSFAPGEDHFPGIGGLGKGTAGVDGEDLEPLGNLDSGFFPLSGGTGSQDSGCKGCQEKTNLIHRNLR